MKTNALTILITLLFTQLCAAKVVVNPHFEFSTDALTFSRHPELDLLVSGKSLCILSAPRPGSPEPSS